MFGLIILVGAFLTCALNFISLLYVPGTEPRSITKSPFTFPKCLNPPSGLFYIPNP